MIIFLAKKIDESYKIINNNKQYYINLLHKLFEIKEIFFKLTDYYEL